MARMVSLMREGLMGMDVDGGLCLNLNDETMEKLGVDTDVEVGDMLHLMIMVKATSVHKDETGCHIGAQIIAGRVEDESTETEEDE